GPTATCANCHTDPQFSPGVAPHAPQQNLLKALDGRQFDPASGLSAPLSGLPSVHSSVDELGGCAKCHGSKLQLANPTDAVPDKSGHLFDINTDNCVPCHTPEDAQTLLSNLQIEIAGRVSELRQRLTAIDRSSLLFASRNLYD